MARSENNPIVAKQTYPDLNLTNYPDDIDTRVNNGNLKGFENLKDYNLAEHVNALSDAVMALQRALGIQPYMDKDSINRTTVSNRVQVLESKDYDTRYGGVGWNLSQTLVGHTHTGGTGHPSQINLVSDIQGLLAKTNLNLDYLSGGLTGADVSVSSTDARKISDAINDKLSISQGGTIRKNLTIAGTLSTRLYRDWDATMREGGALITDYTTLSKQAIRAQGIDYLQFYNPSVYNLLYGKYVLAVRARVSARPTEEVLQIRWYDLINNVWVEKNTMSLKGTDFATGNKWQTFYMTFEHDGDLANSYGNFKIWKPTTATDMMVDIDCVYLMPTHPAIYDR